MNTRRKTYRHGAELPPAPQPTPQLRPLELELLRCLAAGLTIEQAAGELVYSVPHLRRVQAQALRRIGARNRAHAVGLAVAYGLIRAGAAEL